MWGHLASRTSTIDAICHPEQFKMLDSIVINVSPQFQHKPKHKLHAKLCKKMARNLTMFYVTFGSKHLLIINLGTPKDFKKMEGLFIWLFCDKKPKRKFILSLIVEVIGFSILKKDVN
jgi:hypothetical protein